MTWFEEDRALYERERVALADHCPQLGPLKFYPHGVGNYRPFREHVAAARGYISIDPAWADSPAYDVAVICTPAYPWEMPKLLCLDPIFTCDADHHIFSDQTACLCLQLEKRYWWPEGSTLIDFIDRLVLPFLNFQHCKRLGHDYPFGERLHGLDGIYQGLSEVVGIDKPAQLDRIIRLALDPNSLDTRRMQCPCGSGKKLRHCHSSQVLQAIQTVSRGGLIEDLQRCIEPKAEQLLRRIL